MKLTIIIPALNEEKTIASVITSIPKTLSGITEVEVLVIDDGSTDTTRARAQKAGAHVIKHHENVGVGGAFQTGVTHALMRGADIVVNIDADGQFNAADIPRLITPIQNGDVDFVTGSRFANAAAMPTMPGIKVWGNKWMVRIINMVTKKKFTDVSCGFRAFSREAALRLTLFGRFTYTQEMFIDLARKDIAMTEVPITVKGVRDHGRSRVADNLWRYAIKAATIIFRAARDYYPLYFFGVPGFITFIVGLCAGLFLVVHFIQTGQTFPYRRLVDVTGILIIVSTLLFMLTMVADMLQRNRELIEQALYLERKRAYQRNDRSE